MMGSKYWMQWKQGQDTAEAPILQSCYLLYQ